MVIKKKKEVLRLHLVELNGILVNFPGGNKPAQGEKLRAVGDNRVGTQVRQ